MNLINSVDTLNLELVVGFPFVNPSSPSSDKHLISPYNITTWAHVKVMGVMVMITVVKCLDVSSNSPN